MDVSVICGLPDPLLLQLNMTRDAIIMGIRREPGFMMLI